MRLASIIRKVISTVVRFNHQMWRCCNLNIFSQIEIKYPGLPKTMPTASTNYVNLELRSLGMISKLGHYPIIIYTPMDNLLYVFMYIPSLYYQHMLYFVYSWLVPFRLLDCKRPVSKLLAVFLSKMLFFKRIFEISMMIWIK